MKISFSIRPTRTHKTFFLHSDIGKGELEGETREEIIEKATEIANSLEKALPYLGEAAKMECRKKETFSVYLYFENRTKVIKGTKNKITNKKSTMTKKKFNNVIDDILGNDEPIESSVSEEQPVVKKKAGRPRVAEYESRTYRVKKDVVVKLKVLSQTMGKSQKDILDYALEEMISRWEAKNGVIDTSKLEGKNEIKDFF